MLVPALGRLTALMEPCAAWIKFNGRHLAELTPVTLTDLPAGTIELTLGIEYRTAYVRVAIPRNGFVTLEQTLRNLVYRDSHMDDANNKHRPKNATSPTILKQAWLITWEGTELWARPDDWRSIMAILAARRSDRFIKDLLWVLNARAQQSAFGMAYYANRRSEFGLPWRSGPGWRTGGSNAWMYARRVEHLKVSMIGKCEQIEWTEPDWVGSYAETARVVVLNKGQQRLITRDIEEKIGAEPWHRWI